VIELWFREEGVIVEFPNKVIDLIIDHSDGLSSCEPQI
jgi:hypothetical protein